MKESKMCTKFVHRFVHSFVQKFLHRERLYNIRSKADGGLEFFFIQFIAFDGLSNRTTHDSRRWPNLLNKKPVELAEQEPKFDWAPIPHCNLKFTALYSSVDGSPKFETICWINIVKLCLKRFLFPKSEILIFKCETIWTWVSCNNF